MGGAVRDGLLKKRIRDFDFAVAGGEEALARFLDRRGWGRAFPLSPPGAPFPVWRVAGGGRVIDVARFEGARSIEADLARRDFTVNAMAREASRRVLLDPFGGLADLRRGLVRALSEENLRADPLRLLRAYRLAALHGWSIAPETRAMIRRRAAALASVAPERIHGELVRWLESSRPGPAMRLAAQDRVWNAVFPLPGRRPWTAAAARVRPLDGRRRGPRACADRLALVFRHLRVDPLAAAGVLEARKFSRAESRSVAHRLAFFEAALGRGPLLPALFEFRRDLPQLLAILPLAASGERERRRVREARRAARRCRRGAPPVDGHDVRDWLSLKEGRELGMRLREAEYRYFTGEWKSRSAIRRGLREGGRPIDLTRPLG